MSGDVVFVHGTGVREPAFSQAFAIISKRVAAKDKSLRTHPCFWGECCGSKLNAGGKSIPNFDTTRSFERDLEDEEFMLGLWELLYQDPLIELQALALGEQKGKSIFGVESHAQELPEIIKGLEPSPDLLLALAEAGIKQEDFNDAKAIIVKERNYQDAMNGALEPIGEYRLAFARAIVAQSAILVREKYGAQALCLPADNRDKIVALIVDLIGGSDRVILNRVKSGLSGIVKRIGTNHVRKKRGSFSDEISAISGDVIMYQARGQKIRDYIRTALSDLSGPVTLIGHSLGGIASFDLLLEDTPPKVDLLITVGSQVPLLYELDALVNKPFESSHSLPDSFPKWLNIYDENDFLSYIGAGLFTDRVEDIKVASGQPFPESHSAYWNNPFVWSAIFSRLP